MQLQSCVLKVGMGNSQIRVAETFKRFYDNLRRGSNDLKLYSVEVCFIKYANLLSYMNILGKHEPKNYCFNFIRFWGQFLPDMFIQGNIICMFDTSKLLQNKVLKCWNLLISRAAVVHLNFRAGSTFPVTVYTVPSSVDRTSRCNKVDAVRLYVSYRLNLLLLKEQMCVILS